MQGNTVLEPEFNVFQGTSDCINTLTLWFKEKEVIKITGHKDLKDIQNNSFER